MIRILKSSIATVLVMFAIAFVFGYFTEIAHSPAVFDGALLIAMVATGIGTVFLGIWGIPMHLFLLHMRAKSVVWYLLTGFIPAIILIFLIQPFGKDEFPTSLIQVFVFGIFGSVAACVFWFFAWDKPDAGPK